MKRAGKSYEKSLTGCTLGLLFEKASTRTRVSFESAMYRLGGQTLFLSSRDTQLSRGEPVKDTARVLARYLDGLAIRTYSQGLVEEMAEWADIPVINALSDKYHPCQVLSDLMTVKEKKGKLDGLRIAWVGDGNNMANSWINAARTLGFQLALACPSGYGPDGDVLSGAGENIRVTADPREAVSGADVINTDVWASMGQEGQQEERVRIFKDFQVNEGLVKLGSPGAIVMHCLPAHRGEEITDEVADSERSLLFPQAHNRLHAQKALLAHLLGGIPLQ